MSERTAAKPKEKSLRGFYVGMGAVFVLAVGGWVAWTPIKVNYWRQKAWDQDSKTMTDLMYMAEMGVGTKSRPAWCWLPNERPVKKLLDIGPDALCAIEKIYERSSKEGRLKLLLIVRDQRIGRSEWLLPFLLRACQSNDERLAILAIAEIISNCDVRFDEGYRWISRITVSGTVGRSDTYTSSQSEVWIFTPEDPGLFPGRAANVFTGPAVDRERLRRVRKSVLTWWEREGKAKYGSRE